MTTMATTATVHVLPMPMYKMYDFVLPMPMYKMYNLALSLA